MSNVGAGLIVGSRIAVPASVWVLVGWLATPWLRSNGWLGANEPFRRLGFLVGLASIWARRWWTSPLIGRQAMARVPGAGVPASGRGLRDARNFPTRHARRVGALLGRGGGPRRDADCCTSRLGYIVFALALSVVFVLINGISQRRQRPEPHLQCLRGLGAADVGDGAARTRWWRSPARQRPSHLQLGGRRHAAGPLDRVAARDRPHASSSATRCSASAWARCSAWCWPASSCRPTRCWRVNSFDHPEAKVGQWQSAMTYKLVGAIRGLGHLPVHQLVALEVGFGAGPGRSRCCGSSCGPVPGTGPSSSGPAPVPPSAGWRTRCSCPSPYAYAFGTFVELPTALWWGSGGIVSSVWNTPARRRRGPADRRGDGRAAGRHVHHLAGRRWAHRRRVAVLPGSGAHRSRARWSDASRLSGAAAARAPTRRARRRAPSGTLRRGPASGGWSGSRARGGAARRPR